MAYSSDGKRLVSAGDDGSIKIWDTNSGMELFSLEIPAEQPVVRHSALTAGGSLPAVVMAWCGSGMRA